MGDFSCKLHCFKFDDGSLDRLLYTPAQDYRYVGSADRLRAGDRAHVNIPSFEVTRCVTLFCISDTHYTCPSEKVSSGIAQCNRFALSPISASTTLLLSNFGTVENETT
jgi:hypothetical protein